MTNKISIKKPSKKSEITKQHIMDIALKLFSEKGYYNTSIKDIAKTGEISHGLLYNYFDNKEELLKYIFEQGSKKIQNTFENMETQSTNLQVFIVNIFEVLNKNTQLWRLMHTVKMQNKIVKVFKKELDEITAYIVGMLSEYLEEKKINNPNIEALLLYATIDGVSNHYLINNDYPIDYVIKQLINKYK